MDQKLSSILGQIRLLSALPFLVQELKPEQVLALTLLAVVSRQWSSCIISGKVSQTEYLLVEVQRHVLPKHASRPQSH